MSSSVSWYSILINLKSNNSLIFSGKFSVNNTTNAIVHFVSSGNTAVNILGYPTDNYQADYKFVSGNFTFKGTVVKSINKTLETKYGASAWSIWYSDGDTYPNLSYLNTKTWYDLVDNSGNYGNICNFTIAPITAPNSKVIPQTLVTKMYLKIYDKVSLTNIFTSSFIVDLNSKIINTIVNLQDTTTTNKNILAYTTDDNYSDYKLITTTNISSFTMAGTTITSIPALDSIYSACEWQFWNYNGVNCLSYKKNESNEWIALMPLNTINRYSIIISSKP